MDNIRTNEILFGSGSYVESIKLSVFDEEVIIQGRAYSLYSSSKKSIEIDYIDSEFPQCDLPDLLIMIAEEIRFRCER